MGVGPRHLWCGRGSNQKKSSVCASPPPLWPRCGLRALVNLCFPMVSSTQPHTSKSQAPLLYEHHPFAERKQNVISWVDRCHISFKLNQRKSKAPAWHSFTSKPIRPYQAVIPASSQPNTIRHSHGMLPPQRIIQDAK